MFQINEETDRRDVLARVIDPEAWEVYDDPRMLGRGLKVREPIVADSREVANRVIDSGIMSAYEWDRKEYLLALEHIINHTSRTGHCYSVIDVLDGSVMHDTRCPYWPSGATDGSSCIT